jgi:hypothetical protein
VALRRKGRNSETDPKKKRSGPGRIAQIREAYRMSKEHDKNIGLVTLVAALVPLLVFVSLALFLGPWFIWLTLGVPISAVAGLVVFSRRAQRASYQAVAGTPGVSAAVVERMRGQWIVSPAVQLNRDQDMVHRVVGRPGIILLAEGRGAANLIGPEVRRLKRAVGETPIHVLHVGDGEGQVPLAKLQVTMVKLGNVLRAGDVLALDRKIKALPGSSTPLAIPKGPMPTRMPKGARR